MANARHSLKRRESVAVLLKRSGSITDEIRQEIRKSFALFDKEGNGKICAQDFSGFLRLLGMDDSYFNVEQLITRIDLDGNGTIDYEEFETYIKKSGFLKSLPDQDEDDMLDAFNLLDIDGNGFIDRHELESFLKNVRGAKFKDEDVDVMIREADIDGDGRINYIEFKKRLALDL